MDKEVMIAAIGVGGTLLGTLLGWALNNLSNRGKLYTYVSEWKDEFMTGAGGYDCASKSMEEARGYIYSLSLDLYNSSASTKIMRDIKVVFADENSVLWERTPDDETTKKLTVAAIWYDKIKPINVPPKAVMKLNLRDDVWDKNGEMDFIWKTKKIYLQYTDEKNKCRKKLIKKEDYANYFSNHTAEEKK